MTDYVADCPFCKKPVKVPKHLVALTAICPHCSKEICFSEKELIENKENLIREERMKTEYSFIILKFDEVETSLNHLWQEEGWQVVSQSTVFLSETSAGMFGCSGSTRTEGIAYTLKREKIV